MPEQGAEIVPRDDLLTLQELIRLVSVAGELGFRKLRLTGGEPLLRKDICEIVSGGRAAGFRDISLTTNGHLLDSRLSALIAAGLTRVNISLDTLQADRFRRIARRGELQPVLASIDAALASSLRVVKINCVVMRGWNDDEVGVFAAWTMRQPVHVRFIELMPIGWNWNDDAARPDISAFPSSNLIQLKPATTSMLSDLEMRKATITAAEVKKTIEAEHGNLSPAEIETNGPARTFRLENGIGTIGFISQMSEDLCEGCNRIRLTADGFLRPCLMADGEIDVRTILRSNGSDAQLAELFRSAVSTKPERHYTLEGQRAVARNMSSIGG